MVREHLRTVLRINDYPEWAIQRGSKSVAKDNVNGTAQDSTKEKPKGFVVVPYVSGLSEQYKRIMASVGIQVYFKGASTLKSLLCSPKDKDPKDKMQDVIYCINCNDCDEKYVGETGRTLGERYKDHIKSSQSAIYRHAEQTGHNIPSVEEEEIQVLCKESNPIYRKLTEAMYIKYNDPSLNRNIGKADIPDVYDKVLKEEGALSLPNVRNT